MGVGDEVLHMASWSQKVSLKQILCDESTLTMQMSVSKLPRQNKKLAQQNYGMNGLDTMLTYKARVTWSWPEKAPQVVRQVKSQQCWVEIGG